jgi:membrane fusion protein, copper/silver efflux system
MILTAVSSCIRVNNSGNKLIPGMMVYVSPAKTTGKVLAVPRSAVLSEKMKTVWIKTGSDTFEQRMVQTESKEFIQIIPGINEGDLVVTKGAYLVNSQFILKSGAVRKHEHGFSSQKFPITISND